MQTVADMEQVGDEGMEQGIGASLDFLDLTEECMLRVLVFVPAWDRLRAVDMCCRPLKDLSRTPRLWGTLTLRNVSIVAGDTVARIQFLKFVDRIHENLWGLQLLHVNIDLVSEDFPEQLSLPSLRALTCIASWHRELRFAEALLVRLDAPSLRSLTITGPATAGLLTSLGDRVAVMGTNLSELAVSLLGGGSPSSEELRASAKYLSLKIVASARNLKRVKLHLDNRSVLDIIGIPLVRLFPSLSKLETLCLRPLPRSWAEELVVPPVQMESPQSNIPNAAPLSELELKFEDPWAPTLALPQLLCRGTLKELHLHSDSWTQSPLAPSAELVGVWLGQSSQLRKLALRDLRLDISACEAVVRSCPDLQCLEMITGGPLDPKALQLLLEKLPALEEFRCISMRRGSGGDSWSRGALGTLGLYGHRLRRLQLDGPGPCVDARHYVALAQALSVHGTLQHLELSSPLDLTPPRGEGVWLRQEELSAIISFLPSLVKVSIDAKLCGSPDLISKILPKRLQSSLVTLSVDPVCVNV